MTSLLQDLREQRERINNAIVALEGSVGNGRRGRPPGTAKAAAANGRRGRRRLSAAARKKISDAARRRWARAKKAGKNSL